jgi:hypothetical protein
MDYVIIFTLLIAIALALIPGRRREKKQIQNIENLHQISRHTKVTIGARV